MMPRLDESCIFHDTFLNDSTLDAMFSRKIGLDQSLHLHSKKSVSGSCRQKPQIDKGDPPPEGKGPNAWPRDWAPPEPATASLKGSTAQPTRQTCKMSCLLVTKITRFSLLILSIIYLSCPFFFPQYEGNLTITRSWLSSSFPSADS